MKDAYWFLCYSTYVHSRHRAGFELASVVPEPLFQPHFGGSFEIDKGLANSKASRQYNSKTNNHLYPK